jgi:hypothetical protein
MIAPPGNQPQLSIKFTGANIRYHAILGELECNDVQS